MAKNLLIVESPAKAKTIEGYLGQDFTVKSSYGHIRDLVKSEDAIDVSNGFKQKYEVPADKKQVVSELKKLAKEAEMIWLASDEDREGEAISWHLFETLGLKEDNTKRIVFHEITKPAILKAIENPRKINYNLVNAQQARRVLDRLVGFELSPVLWKKVKPALSAGRVQSVAVRLIVEREREINHFKAEAAFRIVAVFDNGKAKETFKAELPERFSKQEDAEKFLQDCIEAAFAVRSLETRPTKRSPAPPFTTSTLQQEASRKLGFSVSRTMTIAQKLYESGKITYMRTDSVNLSDQAIGAAAQQIVSAYGEKYHQTRKYKTKTANAQEAHEAIRPTYFDQHTIDGDAGEKRLYELIWKRAIASQMSEAQFEKTTAKISISTRNEELIANGEVMKFDGFLKVYLESVDEDDNRPDEDNELLPPLEKDQALNLRQMNATERYSRPPARYTEAALVKKLEELGIGRPSTYAPTISTIQNRGYVVKEDRDGKQRTYRVLNLDVKAKSILKEEKSENTGAERGKLFPTDIGAVVNDFLVQYFRDIVDYHFTASVEKQFDEIAQGMKEWTDMIHKFYQPFHQEVESTIQTADKARGERDLGVHPETGKKISVRIGRYGPFVQIGENEEGGDKPLYASLRAGQMIETISLEDALELFKLPKKVGVFEDKEMTVAIGKFGPYIRHNSAFYSLPKGIDPLDVTEQQAIEIILDKRKKDAEKLIKVFDENPEVKILNGRWGPYIEFGKQNIKIPKGKDPQTLTFDEIKELANAAEKEPKKGGKKFTKKK